MKYTESEAIEIALAGLGLEEGKCPDAPWLDAFAGGELPVPLVEAMEAHLESCAECRKILEAVKVALQVEATWEESSSDAGPMSVGTRLPRVSLSGKSENSAQTPESAATDVGRGRLAPASQSIGETRWTVIVRARSATPDAAQALAQLCRAYWYPVYCYLRRAGHAPEAASALVHRFFNEFFASPSFWNAERGRSRFRLILQEAVGKFQAGHLPATGETESSAGGNIVAFSPETAEEWYLSEQTDRPTAQAAFDRGWFNTVLRAASESIERRWQTYDGTFVKALLRCRRIGASVVEVEKVAFEHGKTVEEVQKGLYWIEAQEASALRDAVAETVLEGSVDQEFADLFAAAA